MTLLLISSSTSLAVLIADVLASLRVQVDTVTTASRAIQQIRQFGAPAMTLLLSSGPAEELEKHMTLLRNVLVYNPLYVCSPHNMEAVCNQSMLLNRQLSYPMAGDELTAAVTNTLNVSPVNFAAMGHHQSGTRPFLMA